MSVFSEEKEFSFADYRKRVKSIRKLIPTRSKVFPKDFFPLDLELISSSKNVLTELSSPGSIEIMNPISKRHYSERQVHFEETPLREDTKLNRNYWSDKPIAPELPSGVKKEQPQKPEHALKKLLKIDLSPLIHEREKEKFGLTKKHQSETCNKSKVIRKLNLVQPNSNRSNQESEWNSNRLNFVSETQENMILSEMQKTPNFPTIRKSLNNPSRISYKNANSFLVPPGKENIASLANRAISSKPDVKRPKIVLREQENKKRKDIPGLGLRISMEESKDFISRKSFLPSIHAIRRPLIPRF